MERKGTKARTLLVATAGTKATLDTIRTWVEVEAEAEGADLAVAGDEGDGGSCFVLLYTIVVWDISVRSDGAGWLPTHGIWERLGVEGTARPRQGTRVTLHLVIGNWVCNLLVLVSRAGCEVV